MKKTRIIGMMTSLIGILLLLAACGGDETSIAIGPPTSGTNTLSKLILEGYDISEGDYKKFEEGFGDAKDGVQDGNIGISIGILGLPAANIQELHASTGDVELLSLSDDAIAHIEENSGYTRYTISKDSYEFMDEDVETVAAYAILMANTNTISEELGYQLAKAMIENSGEITHSQGPQMTLDNALNGSEGLPIHPGAAKYYQEQGLEFDNPIAELNITDEKTEFVLGTGSSGGTYYPLGGEMVNMWNNNIDDVSVTHTETDASLQNMADIRDGNQDLGMSVHDPAGQAVHGKGDFEGNAVENAAFIGHIYPEVAQIITREETGINSFEDVK
ncbi:TAXI family TRAP transporter solute-binding subunit [Lentibacillus saliphilus]|uniref:TAXI family TRAP transporter solute-binding subunit n=1 Tax=Lentibacillus saliphilus TaxID=2737028 RepID=UPI001C2F37F5|nr:TAXI family TRAP transporter solute-binding subunit [Lentibacillus saliphilus]